METRREYSQRIDRRILKNNAKRKKMNKKKFEYQRQRDFVHIELPNKKNAMVHEL